MKSSTLVRRFLPYYKKYGKTVAIDLFCAALTTVCELVLPLILSPVSARIAQSRAESAGGSNR